LYAFGRAFAGASVELDDNHQINSLVYKNKRRQFPLEENQKDKEKDSGLFH
jgi:hypothetical protein